MRVIWTTPARKQRDEIIRYIANDNVEAALKLDADISHAISRLAQFPFSSRKGKVAGTREVVVRRNYIIVYEVIDDSIIIDTVIHGARKYP